MKQRSYSRPQGGFSLIEVLISVILISVGVLGMAGLQISSKRASYEAVQRTSATSLAQDAMERMRANPSNISSYATSGVGGGTISTEPTPTCGDNTSNVCTAAELAAHDLWVWEQSIDGAAELSSTGVSVGGLVNPTGCITVAAGVVTIALAWEGYQELSDPGSSNCGAGASKYGTNDEKRQVAVVNSYIADL